MNVSQVRGVFNFVAVFLAVPAAIGYVTGWLAGGSQSPITATVLPLVFGLLGVVGFGAVGGSLIVKRSDNRAVSQAGRHL